MKILVNAAPLLQPWTGIGQYIHNLFHAIEKLRTAELLMILGPRIFNGYVIPNNTGASDALWLRSLLLKTVPYPRATKRLIEEIIFNYTTKNHKHNSIYHEPSYLPFDFDGPLVLTVCDLSSFDHPETHPRERVRLLEKHLPSAIERANHILTISNDSKLALQRWFGVPDYKITVTLLAASSKFAPMKEVNLFSALSGFNLLPKSYVLTVGTLEPRKNLKTLFSAFGKLPKPLRQRYPLVIAGMKGWKYSDLLADAKTLLGDGELKILGYVADSQMASLYSGASAFCYPSRYEGFGLPVIEAMASGVPVLTSNATSLPEIVGEAGLMVSPDDVDNMSNNLRLLLEDDSVALKFSQLGLIQAKRFSWERCARETLGVYQRVWQNTLSIR